ncbi:MAG: hypothetical protein BWY76_02316 [bacterium ADurb.Bin429]|nr:MAG: hypothetical protein BWY76_02316 [bacterium ADurb.Bin429]
MTVLLIVAAREMATGASLGLVKVHSKIATGSALSCTFSGMKGFHARSSAVTGTSGSDSASDATGYSPVKDASLKRLTPSNCG